ncbi:Uu.00g061440.m01.CDS01 [Anthostomella pinea]|uniref:Uu.00g061440.m01.CDS01 n=1 Tax=Anthostomella pinea TaxID=933095 RepID=A0AAI8VTA4_9PEZI|nr:Uu.00g061440.m01.CDS01 [Anthostomella pinea]
MDEVDHASKLRVRDPAGLIVVSFVGFNFPFLKEASPSEVHVQLFLHEAKAKRQELWLMRMSREDQKPPCISLKF